MKLPTTLMYFFFTVVSFLAVPTVAGSRTAGNPITKVEQQRLQLKLVGTAIADDPTYNVAVIISDIDGRQRSYHEGDQAGKVLIKEILRNRVIIQTGQGEEFIGLSRPLHAESERTGARQVPPVVFGSRPPDRWRHQTLYLDGKTLTAEFENFNDTIQEANVYAVSIYDQPAGVKIYPIKPDSIFSKMGLKAGDVIKEINGMKITRPEQAIALFQQCKKGDDMDIKVKSKRTRQIHLVIE